ncbi:hypothetical protein [Nostoc sp. JL33]|uniref:hypothetical protein n=1 Tax=Nostoc sp. JL33 TaxID=2815396 RepID=UPI0034226DD7
MKNYDLSIKLTLREQSIIVGSLLGDASIQRGSWKGKQCNARVKFTHGKTQLPYLKWKEKELQRWIGTSVTEKPVSTEYGGLIHQVSTLTHPVFTEIWHLIKPEGKKKRITQELLPLLDDLAIAVWFMDDGSMGQVSSTIAAYSFPQEDLEQACNLLTQKGITSKVLQTCKGRIISINAEGTRILREVVKPFIHPCLSYKLGTIVPKNCVICQDNFQIYKGSQMRQTCSPKCEGILRGRMTSQTALLSRLIVTCPICGVVHSPKKAGRQTKKTCGKKNCVQKVRIMSRKNGSTV